MRTGSSPVEVGAGIETLDMPREAAKATSEFPRSEEIVEIELRTLLDPDGQLRTVDVRGELHEETVAHYAEAMRNGDKDKFPPIVVYEVTDRGGERYLSAGWHRSTAARRVGLTTLRGYLRQGTWYEALHCGLETNAKHGQRPSAADIRRSLEQMAAEPTMAKWSNSAKARSLGVDEGTVRYHLKKIAADSEFPRSAPGTASRQPEVQFSDWVEDSADRASHDQRQDDDGRDAGHLRDVVKTVERLRDQMRHHDLAALTPSALSGYPHLDQDARTLQSVAGTLANLAATMGKAA